MKKCLFFMVGFISLISFGQNYQTIKSNQIHFFGTTDSSYFLATRTDSVELSGLDSIFYSFKTIRENDTATVWTCNFYEGPNWYGSKVIIASSGENHFFNKIGDTITINTLAMVNDTFTVYNYPSGKFIKGTVTTIDTMTVLGSLDSVKTIDLFSDTTFSISNPQILLAKNHGFVSFFAPYNFPEPYNVFPASNYISSYTSSFELVGSQFPDIGINKLTREEVFDFDPGDRIIVNSMSYDAMGGGSSGTGRLERDFLSETNYGLDSVEFLVHDTSMSKSYYDGVLINETYSGGDHIIKYYELGEFYFDLYPEELDINSGGRWIYLHENSCGQIEELKANEAFYYMDQGNSPCLENAGLSWFSYKNWCITGLGGYGPSGYTDPGFSTVSNVTLTYFYKSSTGNECGTNSYLSDETHILESTELTIYPNPTSGEFILQGPEILQGAYKLQILDITGKLIYSESVAENQIHSGYLIDLSNAETGIYFVRLENGESIFQTKVIKN